MVGPCARWDHPRGRGRCSEAHRRQFLGDYGKPFATPAIVDLLGVPGETRAAIRRTSGPVTSPGARVSALDREPVARNPLTHLGGLVSGYIAERREAFGRRINTRGLDPTRETAIGEPSTACLPTASTAKSSPPAARPHRVARRVHPGGLTTVKRRSPRDRPWLATRRPASRPRPPRRGPADRPPRPAP